MQNKIRIPRLDFQGLMGKSKKQCFFLVVLEFQDLVSKFLYHNICGFLIWPFLFCIHIDSKKILKELTRDKLSSKFQMAEKR